MRSWWNDASGRLAAIGVDKGLLKGAVLIPVEALGDVRGDRVTTAGKAAEVERAHTV